MDPSTNAWASATEQSSRHPLIQMRGVVTQNLPLTPTPVNHYESVIEKLTKELESIKSSLNADSRPSKSKAVKGKNPAVKSSLPPAKNSGSSSGSASKKKTPVPTTPKRGDRAASAPPAFQQKAPKVRKPAAETTVAKPSPKRHPQHMQTRDFPHAFQPTKVHHQISSQFCGWTDVDFYLHCL